ncbi:MAG TPA: adenylate/guanylate cyclase domain-containing protein, partial [Actinomycetota bacterium]|nr:adenylate/guanylate cyclase domain-containing protein [Actinomycetota bacterium]
MPPETRYARSGDAHIAYQVVGDGSIDLIQISGWVSHIELLWDNPLVERFWRRLSSFSRLILMDRRGTGASDRVALADLPSLEARMEDLKAVLDAAGSRRAVLFAVSEGGPMAILFAATYPERTRALVLFGSFAALSPDESLIAANGGTQEIFEARLEERWAEGFPGIDTWAPSLADVPNADRALARFNRTSVSPSAARALFRMVLDTDVSDVLPVLRVPTLVLVRRGDRAVHAAHSARLAAAIPDARLVELQGEDHLEWAGDQDGLIDEIQEFVTGARSFVDPDRALATVLFTDIVGSTDHLARVGDKAWRTILDGHERASRIYIERHEGRLIESTGDGVLATFQGPAHAIRCATDISAEVKDLGIEIRAGIHTGEIELRGSNIGGLAVHLTARVMSLAGAGEIAVSRTVTDL